MIDLVVLFISVIIASGVCSMAEAAILSLPLVRARILFEQKRKQSKDLLHIKENIEYAVASIVIINNAINIIGSIFVGQHVASRFGNQWLGVASAVLTFCIIVISEIIPKTVGERYKVKISLVVARPIKIIIWLFRPLVSVIMSITRTFIKEKKLPKVTEDEIKMMLRLGRVEGTVEMDEEVLCNRVFKLNDVRAIQIMRPIDEMYALPADKSLGELREQIINSRFSRIVVYDNNVLDIIGVVQHRILLREIAKDNYRANIKDFMKPPIFVNWFTKADELLEKFQAYNQHLFIVQDAQHKSVGLVTMEDVLEELFGEIYDEKDNVKPDLSIH